MEQGFKKYSAYVLVMYFFGMIGLSMFIRNPIYISISFIAGFSLLLIIKPKRIVSILLSFMILFITFTLLSPLFSVLHFHSLHQIIQDAYTMQNMSFAFVNAGLLLSVICWCVNYQECISSDKVMFVFGKILPIFSLLITMINRLIPNYIYKYKMILQARLGIGKQSATKRFYKIKEGALMMSSLTSIAFEDALIQADSMKGRGWGSKKRTYFKNTRMNLEDKKLGLLIIVLLLVCIGLLLQAQTGFIMYCSYSAYTLYATLPLFIIIWEEIVWNISRLKI